MKLLGIKKKRKEWNVEKDKKKERFRIALFAR